MLRVCRQAGGVGSSSSSHRAQGWFAQTSIPVTRAAAGATGSPCSNVPGRNQSLLLATLTRLGHILLLHLWRALHFGGAALLVQRMRLLQCRQTAMAAMRLARLWHAAFPAAGHGCVDPAVRTRQQQPASRPIQQLALCLGYCTCGCWIRWLHTAWAEQLPLRGVCQQQWTSTHDGTAAGWQMRGCTSPGRCPEQVRMLVPAAAVPAAVTPLKLHPMPLTSTGWWWRTWGSPE